MKGKCPICNSEREEVNKNKWFPFCCQKCKMIDLYYWLNGDYCVSEYLSQESLEEIKERLEELDK